MPSSSDVAPSWWALRFEALAALDPALLGSVDDRALAEAAFIEVLAELGPAQRVLDVGCGGGRHVIALAERGHAVTGVDLSPRILRLARQAWEARNPALKGPTWMPGDMRWLPTCGQFEAALLLDGAFGMFEGDGDHRKTLVSIAQHLTPGGCLVIQTPNPYHWASRGRAQHSPPGALAEGMDVIRSSRFDADEGRLEERFVAFRDGKRHDVPPQSLRTYTPPELVALLHDAGFEAVEVYGSEGWAVPEEPGPLHATDSVWLWVRAFL